MTELIELLEAKNKLDALIFKNTGSYTGTGISQSEGLVNVYLRDTSENSKKKLYELLGSKKVDGTDIKFVPSGNVVALQCPTSRTAYSRPECGGSSIGRGDIGAGTLATICYDAVTKEKRLLSNSHVFSGASSYQHPNATVGDVIYSPGLLDSSGIKYPIGKLNKWIELDETVSNFVDCAISTLDNPNDINSEIIGIGNVSGYEEPTENIILQKSGRSSGLTEAAVSDFNASIEVDYGGRMIRFANCIITNAMGIPGDSGSLAVRKDNKNAVGLLFAGSDTITVFNRISYVMNNLNVTLTPNGTVPTPSYATSSNDINYQAQSLAIATLGTAAFIGILPAIEQQLHLALSRRF